VPPPSMSQPRPGPQITPLAQGCPSLGRSTHVCVASSQ
jgi:hypothetical protein